jgi:hypothetical protein
MTEQEKGDNKQQLWYIRRAGNIRGPFPCGAVRRSVLLGRVRLDDEASMDRSNWKLVSNVPDVVPPEVRKALESGDREALDLLRMREDERTGRERRSAKDDVEFKERRHGERRQEEGELVTRHREAKSELLEIEERRRKPYVGMLVVSLLVVAAIGGGLFIGAPQAIPEPDCFAPPAPGVNWRNCRLDETVAENSDLSGAHINNAVLRQARLSGSSFKGADLKYTDFTGADLSYGEFVNAAMKGVNLQNADLTNADLSGSDLSFANLNGARLGGAKMSWARLDGAIWIDGRTCGVGSLGGCKKIPE